MTKRDPEIIRALLLQIEADADLNGISRCRLSLSLDGTNEEQVLYHLRQLVLDGYIDEGELTQSGDFVLRGLSPKAHDFLDATRDESIWKAVKKKVQEVGGGATIDTMKAVAVDYLKTQLGV